MVRDELGNTVTSFTGNVTVALGSNPSGGVLAGNTTMAAVNGVASFATLSVNRTGIGYTLTATAPDLTGATSATFSVTAGRATALVFTAQPTATTAGGSFTPVVQVSAQDNFGNTDPSFTGNVTVALATNPAGGVLAGATTVTTVTGVASFAALSVDKTGSGYTLVAAAPGVISAGSAVFDISHAAASQIAVAAGDHQGATAGSAVAIPPAVIVRDPFGNPVPGVGVVFAVTSGDGSLIGTNPITTDGSGLAAIGGWTLGAVPGVNTLTATATGLAGSPVPFAATGTSVNAGRPNEPAGFTKISENAFDAVPPTVQTAASDYWFANDAVLMSIVDDPTAPQSPSAVAGSHFTPAGAFHDGMSATSVERDFTDGGGLNYPRVYVSAWVKHSSNWVPHPVGSKLFWFQTPASCNGRNGTYATYDASLMQVGINQQNCQDRLMRANVGDPTYWFEARRLGSCRRKSRRRSRRSACGLTASWCATTPTYSGRSTQGIRMYGAGSDGRIPTGDWTGPTRTSGSMWTTSTSAEVTETAAS